VDEQNDVVESEFVDEPVENAGVVARQAREGGRLLRAPEAEEVGRDDPHLRRARRDHLAVEERPRRVAVQAEERRPRPGTLVDVVDAPLGEREEPRVEREQRAVEPRRVGDRGGRPRGGGTHREREAPKRLKPRRPAER
jgi:hypothetical protein